MKSSSSSKPCRVCGNTDKNTQYVVREMMFGFRDEFSYIECSFCGCLQIEEYPNNIEKYYPKGYWSHEIDKTFLASPNSIKNELRRQRTRHYLGLPNIGGWLLAKIKSPPIIPIFTGWSWLETFKKAKLNLKSAILDIGCGTGETLYYLRQEGFSNLTGIDPFIENETSIPSIKILRKKIFDVEDKFDFIMLHHSFEHMQNPHAVFDHLYQLLNPNRFLLIRIPVASSIAWNTYRNDWVQIDAPRHLYIHTVKSMQVLSKKYDFTISSIDYDSFEFQFWASELYQKDIPLVESQAYLPGSKSAIFSAQTLAKFKRDAENLNLQSLGDQACFLLYKK
jgi:2-polyprenyl-3-methyl-5-hydroxy-6-metoxy-1,4-benzoquinol methylase